MNSVDKISVEQWFDDARISFGALSSAQEVSAAIAAAPNDLATGGLISEYRELGVCSGRNSLLMFSNADSFEDIPDHLNNVEEPENTQQLYSWLVGFAEGYRAVKEDQAMSA